MCIRDRLDWGPALAPLPAPLSRGGACAPLPDGPSPGLVWLRAYEKTWRACSSAAMTLRSHKAGPHAP
eukprot:6204512-Alexandrium_andersonii.AAC.1